MPENISLISHRQLNLRFHQSVFVLSQSKKSYFTYMPIDKPIHLENSGKQKRRKQFLGEINIIHYSRNLIINFI
jgi:hypothetical protein